ncbi:MAG: type IV toxin-antitoxin system AbiEi family antitoxin domain-containing protein [Micrococcales bacterium]|nr:type IV toxin-antitoxin system AbiEi family antitoxin domain-containing protein [Micrococcales bacterium]MCL2666521.1 type IV toxin-antitoxin system AbiEi family antitoxin domain-containing protein [Micrococcales bacterium]
MTMTARRVLWDHALDSYGVVTTDDARALGISAATLRKLAARGFLEHLAYGVYRCPDVPETAWTEYAEAVACVGAEAYLVGEAVLAMHDLTQVNPLKIQVATPRRWRGAAPQHVAVIDQCYPRGPVVEYGGIRSACVADALVDCVGRVPGDRLHAAMDKAVDEGLVSHDDRTALVAALDATS